MNGWTNIQWKSKMPLVRWINTNQELNLPLNWLAIQNRGAHYLGRLSLGRGKEQHLVGQCGRRQRDRPSEFLEVVWNDLVLRQWQGGLVPCKTREKSVKTIVTWRVSFINVSARQLNVGITWQYYVFKLQTYIQELIPQCYSEWCLLSICYSEGALQVSGYYVRISNWCGRCRRSVWSMKMWSKGGGGGGMRGGGDDG